MRRSTFVWIIILVVMIGVIYLPGLSKYLKLKHKELDLEREIKQLDAQIAELKQEEHLLKTDLTQLEQVVREELGLVRPGEIVYKVVEEEVPGELPIQSQNNSGKS